MSRHPLWFATPLFAVVLAAVAQERIEVIDLSSRSAEEMVPLLAPLVEPQGTVTGRGFQLIIRTDSGRIEELRKLVEQLDRPAQTLGISVYQGRAGDLATSGPSNRVHQTRGKEDQTHRIRVLEGRPAFIATGDEQPLPYGVTVTGPAGIRHIQGTNWRPNARGFRVLPRLSGDRVTLEIHPFTERVDPNTGIAEGMGAATTLTGRLGEWIPVGGATLDIREETRTPTHRRSTLDTEERQIWLRVDASDP